MSRPKRSRPVEDEADEPAPKLSTVDEEAKADFNDWLCAACLQFQGPSETPDNPGVLLMCDGPCRRSWHMECLDMETPPIGDQWLCPDCEARQHPCAVCLDVSHVDTIGGVIKCSVPRCPFFFRACHAGLNRASNL